MVEGVNEGQEARGVPESTERTTQPSVRDRRKRRRKVKQAGDGDNEEGVEGKHSGKGIDRQDVPAELMQPNEAILGRVQAFAEVGREVVVVDGRNCFEGGVIELEWSGVLGVTDGGAGVFKLYPIWQGKLLVT